MSDFKPGLEGVVAVETEIAEPDREGRRAPVPGRGHRGARRARTRTTTSGGSSSTTTSIALPDPEPYEPAALTGNAPADLQAETARLAGEWELGKLNEISDAQAATISAGSPRR